MSRSSTNWKPVSAGGSKVGEEKQRGDEGRDGRDEGKPLRVALRRLVLAAQEQGP